VDTREAARLLLGVLFALGTMLAVGAEGLSPHRVVAAVRLVVWGILPLAPERQD